jgi:hypothetical protein
MMKSPIKKSYRKLKVPKNGGARKAKTKGSLMGAILEYLFSKMRVPLG